MRKIVSRAGHTAARFVALALLLAGCAGDLDEVNRVQPNYIRKADLLGSSWYYRRTVVDAPETMADYATVGTGDLFTIERIRWDVQESFLYAYRDYEYVPGSEAIDENDDYYGSPIAAFPIESHFDIRPEYNPETGEETNVVSENTTDRMWYEREYMRVNFATYSVNDLGFEWFILPVNLLDVDGSQGGSHIVHPDDAANPWHARLEPEKGYLDFVINHMVETDPWTCLLTYEFNLNPFVCGSGEIRVRHAFWKVDPTREAGYEPMRFPDSVTLKDEFGNDAVDAATGEVKREPIFDRFGYYRLERLTYDNLRELTESGRLYRIVRFDIWDRSVDDAGNEIPYAQRQVRPIHYYVNADFPEDLLTPDTASHMSPLDEVAAGWNDVFKTTVASLQGRPVSQVPDVFIIHRNDCNVDNVIAYLGSHADVSDAAVATMGMEATPENVHAKLMNWCSAVEYHSKGLADAFTWQQIGDPRYNMLYWINDPLPAGWSGYGPMLGDPVSGRNVTSSAFLMGWTLENAATKILDYVDYINGQMTLEEVIDGSYLPYDAEAFAAQGVNASMLPLDMALKNATENQPTEAFLASLKARLRQADLKGGGQGLTRLENSDYFNERISRVTGTSLEGDWLLRPEDLMLAGRGNWEPGMPVSNELLRDASFGTRNIEINARRRELDRFFRERAFDTIGMELDPVLTGLAKDLKDISDRATRREIVRKTLFKAVALHELGHNIGLRHNFESSYDALNYPRHYWDLATSLGVTTQGRITPEAYESRIGEYMYSSIMDYHGKSNADFGGLAPYDYAAIKFGYGQLIETFRDSNMPAGKSLKAWRYENNYTKLADHLGGVDKMFDRVDVTFDWNKPGLKVSEVAELTKSEVPYLFCTDELDGVTPTCKTFDFGASQSEVAQADIIGYKNYRIFSNFLRNRLTLDMDRIVYRGYSAFMETVMTYQYFMLWEQQYKARGQEFLDTDLGKDMVAAFTAGFNLMTDVLSEPEPGYYTRCIQHVRKPGPNPGDPDVTEDHVIYYPHEYVDYNPLLKRWEGMGYDETCDEPNYGDRRDQTNIDPVTKEPRLLAVKDVLIPVSPDAQPFFLGFSDDFVAWTFTYYGTYWDKESAIMGLTYPVAYYPRINSEEDWRYYSVSPYRLFDREILTLFRNFMRYDLLTLGPTFDVETAPAGAAAACNTKSAGDACNYSFTDSATNLSTPVSGVCTPWPTISSPVLCSAQGLPPPPKCPATAPIAAAVTSCGGKTMAALCTYVDGAATIYGQCTNCPSTDSPLACVEQTAPMPPPAVDANMQPLRSMKTLKLFDASRALPLKADDDTPLPTGTAVIYPAMARNLQRYTTLYGTAFLTSPYDTTLDFGAHMKVALDGGVDDVNVTGPAANEARCTIPQSGYTYKAWQTADEFGIGFQLVSDCRRFIDVELAEAITAVTTAETNVANAEAALAGCADQQVCQATLDAARVALRQAEQKRLRAEGEVNEIEQMLQWARLINLVYEYGAGL